MKNNVARKTFCIKRILNPVYDDKVCTVKDKKRKNDFFFFNDYYVRYLYIFRSFLLL